MQTLYKYFPVFIQNVIISVYGYFWYKQRHGKIFKQELSYWREREAYTKEQWKVYQTKELRKLLIYAFEKVPLYRKKYSEAGFSVEDFKNFEIKDLKRLPYLEKEELRKYGKSELLSVEKNKGSFYYSSGSTGTPTAVYFSDKTRQKWFAAYEVRARNWAGVNYKTARGMVGGRRVISDSRAKKPFYRYNFVEKQTYFSAYHINQGNVENYVKGIIKNKVKYMVGYAMSNFFLADFIVKNNLKVPKLKAVMTSSEKLTQEMREVFMKAYGCKTYDGYSGVESCGLISENKEGDFLFSPDTGIMEVIDSKGKDVPNGVEGEIIATGLLNYDQPLIRYRIGDRVKMSVDQNTKSGLQMPKVDEICGRIEDVVLGSDGRKMVRFHSVFLEIEGLMMSQVIQETLTQLVIKLKVHSYFQKQESEIVMKKRIQSQLGTDVEVEFRYVSEFPLTKNGKVKAVISKL